MFSARQLTEEQKADLHQWAGEGATIADLQKRLKEVHGLTITYMDARFMVLDLGIEIREAKEEETKPAEDPLQDDLADGLPREAAGGVAVSIDAIAIPGALVSGKVTFSDGQTGVWMIDQYGRPALDPDQPGYRPGAEDIREFQAKLSALLKSEGY